MRNPLLAAILLAASASPAAGAASVKKTITCPIGGGTFEYSVPASSASLGERPDGKPYGGAFPVPLPQCPGNGLVLYKDYTPKEAAKLEPLIASDTYQALRRDGTPYYRAYWLMREMGVAPEDYLWALLQASWEADGRPELRARYLAELAEASAKVPARPSDLNWIGMEGRAINALRELGRFDEALARLGKVPLKSLEVAAPSPDAPAAAAREARTRRAWLNYFRQVRTAIERKDASLEPFDLLPRAVAFGRCIDAAASLDETQKAFCRKESVGVEELRVARQKAADELKALQRSREESGR